MVMITNDLDDEDDVIPGGQQQQQQVVDTPPPANQDGEDDIISDFLKTKGIEDYNKINFEDDNGVITSRAWKDLSKEEKLNILGTPLEVEEPKDNNDNDLSEQELLFINYLRENNLTPEQYIQSLQYSEPTYKVDDLSDDELYLLDLEARVGEMSEEMETQALAVAKQNEELYKKQVEGIRKEYKEREDYESQQNQAQLEEEQQEAFARYQQSVVNAIESFKSVGNLDLTFEDTDKEELAEFMLSQDEDGVNYLYKALQEPETLVKAAWFILNGDEALNGISDYYTQQMKLISENQYKKGYDDAKKGNQPKTVIVDKPETRKVVNSIDDLDD